MFGQMSAGKRLNIGLAEAAWTSPGSSDPWDEPFLAEPRKQELEVLLEWMVAAGEANVSVAFDDRTAKVLRTLGQPLELVNLGQTKASLRLDSRFVKDVMQRADQDSVTWAPIAEHLRDAYGLQPIVVDLFLCFLCQRDHRALTEAGGEPVEVKLGMPPASRLRLQRGTVVAAAPSPRPGRAPLRGGATAGPPFEPPSDVLYEASLDPADGDEVSELLGGVRRALEGLGEGRVRVALVRRG
jgi:hypothetical protein